jgi:hypothetical protein
VDHSDLRLSASICRSCFFAFSAIFRGYYVFSLREIFSGFRAAVGCGVRSEELFDLAPGWNTALAAGLSGFQAGSGGGKTDTLVEGSSLD